MTIDELRELGERATKGLAITQFVCTKCGFVRAATEGELAAVCDRCPYMMIGTVDRVLSVNALTDLRNHWDALVDLAEAAEKLRKLHVKRDQMIDNDTWEDEGAIPTYTAIANAEKRVAESLSALTPKEGDK